MAKVVWRRLGMLVLVLVCVSIGTFLMTRVMPGNPAQVIAGPHASPATIASIKHQLGLDKPLPVQYVEYVDGLLHGNLGISTNSQRPVASDLLAFFPATLELVAYAFIVALLIGVPLGVLGAVKKNSVFDYISRIVSIAGLSMPTFWFGLILILVFYGSFGLLPPGGRFAITLTPPVRITGLYTVDSVLTGNWSGLGDALQHLILPVAALAYVQLAIVVRQLRASLIHVLSLDYVRTARACGLSPWTVIVRYGLRNSLVPMLTILGVSFGSLLGGAIVTETVFNWPGMGHYVVESITSLDFPAIMGFTVVISVAYVLVNLIVDLINIGLNPETRRGPGR